MLMSVDAHRLAEERSIAYHRAIAERLRTNPEVLELALARVRAWLGGPGEPPHFARAWQEILRRNREELCSFLTDDGEAARELRRSSPFAGVLTPTERWEIWRRVATELEREP